MWKIIILTAFLSVCQAADINKLYGTYTAVMGSLHLSAPICVKYSFAEDPRKIQCTCSDGAKSTLVEVKFLERLTPSGVENIPVAVSAPMLVIDKVDDIVLAVNATCNCAEKKFNYRGVFKVVNENYTMTYVRNVPRYADNRNVDYLMARNLPSAAELEADLTDMAEIKHMRGSVLCTREMYEQLRSKHRPVRERAPSVEAAHLLTA